MRAQPQMRENALDHRWFFDNSDDLQVTPRASASPILKREFYNRTSGNSNVTAAGYFWPTVDILGDMGSWVFDSGPGSMSQ